MNRKLIYSKLAIGLMCAVFLYGCGTKPETGNSNTDLNQTAQKVMDVKSVLGKFVSFDNEDAFTDWKNENSSLIKLGGDTASIDGVGAEVSGGKITINSSGTYIISGKLDNGQIIVDVQDKGTVRLVLNGAEINCSYSAPIYVKSAKKIIITLEADTQNVITDGVEYTLDASSDEPSAAIFSKDDLVINGTGTLIVKANYRDGITSKDDLKITGGNIQITSIDDGIVGRDILAVKEANISIEAGGDGAKSSNDKDSTKGIVAIESGTFNIKTENDGIQGETYVLIGDGVFNITTGGGSANGIKKAEEGMKGIRRLSGGSDISKNNIASAAETDTESKKAIKAGGDIGIAGGTFSIDSADDSIHSNSSVYFEAGNFTIASGDDGIHADFTLIIKGGEINITKSYEGIEASVIAVSDGQLHVTASDDGINAGGGADGSSINGRFGQNNFQGSGDNKLHINGGYIIVDSAGDGLDANGSIYMSGGTVVINGPTNNGNGALDYNKTFEMTGGILMAAGSSGMAQAPSDTSTQYAILMTYSDVQAKGTTVNLEDISGKSIVTFTPSKEYQSVVISSPEIKKGGSYTLCSGAESLVSFTVSNPVTYLNESGVTSSPANMGGPRGRGDFKGRRSPRNMDGAQSVVQ